MKFNPLILALCVLSLVLVLPTCQSAAPPGSLTLEEHTLLGPPDADRGIFQPLDLTQEQVLLAHQALRERTVSNEVFQAEGDPYPIMASRGTGPELTAALVTDPADPPRQIVELRQDGQLIFSADAGLPSPALPLQRLWTYGDHWALEILYAEDEIWEGRIYRDSELLNESLGYDEAFGFQLLAGEPFYFFQREEGLGYSYAGVETALPFDQILHYGCCSASSLNPIPSEKMVSFFALSGEEWTYAELGDFSQP